MANNNTTNTTTSPGSLQKIGMEFLKPEVQQYIQGIAQSEAQNVITKSAGAVDLSYTYEQIAPSTVWAINHNMGKFPSVTIVDSAGTEVIGEVSYQDKSNLKISFSAPFSGTAYLN
jgi:hypothetical protein